MKHSELLESEIDKTYKDVRKSFNHTAYYAIQILTRRLDAFSLFNTKGEGLSETQLLQNLESIKLGWGPLLKLFLDDNDFSESYPFIETRHYDYRWADTSLIRCGHAAMLKQILDYEKAGLLNLVTGSKRNSYEIKYTTNQVYDSHFERESVKFFQTEVIDRMLQERSGKAPCSKEEVLFKLRSIIKNPYTKFLSYHAPEDIVSYYREEARASILRMRNYEDFCENDRFGGIEYGVYLDVVEEVIGMSLLHIDACLELIQMNPKVDMHNILTYTYFKSPSIKSLSDVTGLHEHLIARVLSSASLTKENYKYHLTVPLASAPMYIEPSKDQIIRSASGAVLNPVYFMNRELKRKHPNDYFKAVNNREERFRKDLFHFFPHPRIIKLQKGINIYFNGARTDIDAVCFDKEVKALGLFQLKWQDPFGHSMKERYSRMTNMFPKANEWLDKMQYWLTNNDQKTICNALQISKVDTQATSINEVYLFVINRYDINFSGNQLDERAAWSSWYQLVEAMAKIGVGTTSPIKEMYYKIKTFSPQIRALQAAQLPVRQNLDLNVGQFHVFYRQEK